jgi:hypothetical protein
MPSTQLNGQYLADPDDVPSVDELIQGYRNPSYKHTPAAIRVIGGTITPCKG